jgi:hypothetical protein
MYARRNGPLPRSRQAGRLFRAAKPESLDEMENLLPHACLYPFSSDYSKAK